MANKYLDGAGLDHMWDKIKTYLTSNYAAKSHTHTIAQITNLQTTLNGKANSSHTHTSNQITDLVITKITYDTISFTSGSTTKTIAAMSVGEIKFNVTTASASKDKQTSYVLKLPSGGKYHLFVNKNNLAGGTTLVDDYISGTSSGSRSMTYYYTILRVS